MRLGEQPDPAADRARRLLRQARVWLGRRGPRLLLLCLVLLVACSAGVIIGLGLAAFSGVTPNSDLESANVATVAGMIRAVGLDPGDTFLILSGIKNVNVGLPAHFVQGALSNPERIELDIKELDYQRLAYERDTALRQGMWLPSDDDYVPVTVRNANQTLQGKARLKGDWPDHWYSEKWSLRFKLNGSDRLDHMREFALQGPRTRNYMAEWLFQQALAREGVSGLSYGFVDVTINGKAMGTYAIEEAFDDEICWYNREVPGPLLRFSDTAFWESRAAGLQMVDAYHEVPLDVFGGNATKQGYAEADAAAALSLLERWRNGEVPTRDAFDINRTARYFALSDLHGNIHGNIFHNIRFYYNPISARLEPVGHDANAGGPISTILGASTDPQYRRFFDDPVLFERYIAELDRVTAPAYLETFFAELDPAIQSNVSIIYRDQPFYFLDRRPYFDNRETIRALLHPFSAVSAYVENASSPDGPVIEIGSSQLVPVEVTAVTADGVRAVPAGGPVRLPGKASKEPIAFQTVAFTLPSGAVWNAAAPVEVECRLIGTTELRYETVTPRKRLPGAMTAGALARLPANVDRFGFAVTDIAHRTVTLLPGRHVIAEPLIAPEGYAIRCGPGTTFDLVQNASIVARGPLEWEGTETDPITVLSSDGTGRGVLVLRAPNASTLGNVRIEGLSAPSADPGPGAALTFLEGQVLLNRVSLTGNRTAPLLRLIDCRFNATECAFTGASGAAVSIEFSKGTLSDLLVTDGAGIDVAGSAVSLERARFERIGGTAILAERQSNLYGAEIVCSWAGTAVACDSGSTATVDSIAVHDGGVVARAGKGETGFGPGRLELTLVDYGNVTTPYVREGGGIIRVDGRSVGR